MFPALNFHELAKSRVFLYSFAVHDGWKNSPNLKNLSLMGMFLKIFYWGVKLILMFLLKKHPLSAIYSLKYEFSI